MTACGGRRPGPHAYESGRVTQWKVEDASLIYDACTDEPSWRSGVELPLATIGWYVAYMLSDDGTEAADYDCDTTDATTCYPNPAGFVWQVDGHTLTYDLLPVTIDLLGTTCKVQLDRVWTVEDQGSSAIVRDQETVSLIGDSTECARVDDQIRSESPNGLGYQGATVTMIANTSFFNSSTP